MLYIRGHKIIKGYVGNTPISHAGFGKSGLIKIKSENGGSDYPNNLIAKYTANTSGVLPTFNTGYQYTINETESNGVYTVELFSDDDFTSCSFNGKTQLLTVDYLKVADKVTTMNNMFRSCSQLTQLDVSNWDTSKVTNMGGMFDNCLKLTQLDVSNWDTSKVTTTSYMFQSCSQLTQLDVSNWDTSNVTSMQNMFNNCLKLTQLDVSNFDTSNVKSMSYMFYNCNQLTQLDVSNWVTNNITTMSFMFRGCSQLTRLDVSNFNTSNVVDMSSMFKGCSSLVSLDLSGWNMNKATAYGDMLTTTPMLAHIIMTNSDYNSVNKVIGSLESKTSEVGCLDITGVDDISLVDEETLNSKNWALLNVGH